MISDYFNFALVGLKHRRARSLLTIMGIVIGIGAIIALITISQGLENAIEEQFELFGKDRILVGPQGFQGPGTQSEGLTTKDVDTIEDLGEFKYVTSFLSRTVELERKNEIKFGLVVGFPADNLEESFGDIDVQMEEGRFYREGEKFVTVLGIRAAGELFKEEMRVRNRFKINGQTFKVIGILEEIGNPQDDNQVTIPMVAARDIFDEPDKVDGIMAQVKPGGDILQIGDRIERALEKARDDENFQVLTPTQILEQIGQILGIVQFVLVGIAAISLIVGGIGIMNSMYTSVLERTKEIGIMKAIGARNKDVLMIFLVESGILGIIGGFFGVIIGLTIAKLVGFAAAQAGFQLLKIEINYGLVVFGLVFAFFVGMISGVVPAYQASKLKPVDALRYG